MSINLVYMYENNVPEYEMKYQLSNKLETELNYLSGKGRPPKWYKSLVNYLHENDIIHQMEGDSVWKNRLEILGYCQNIHLDRLIDIFNYLMENQ